MHNLLIKAGDDLSQEAINGLIKDAEDPSNVKKYSYYHYTPTK